MIRLHKQDGNEILLNESRVRKIVEEDGGTVLILSDGDSISVKNSLSDIQTKIEAANLGESE